MATVKTAIIALMVSALFLGACGRRGSLERPPAANEEDEKRDKGFVLDPLIKSKI